MKKIFFALVAMAAIAACAKTEPVYTEDNSEIKISPATALATKANVLQAVDGTEYPTKENFDVFAYWANEPAGSTFTNGTQSMRVTTLVLNLLTRATIGVVQLLIIGQRTDHSVSLLIARHQ